MAPAKLAPCPQCGLSPEWSWRGHGPATRYAALRCPYNHRRVAMPYHAGSERTARATLTERWETMVAEEAGDSRQKS